MIWQSVLSAQTYFGGYCVVKDGVLLSGSGSNGVVYKSEDYGETWASQDTFSGQNNVRQLCRVTDDIVIAGTGNNGQIWRSSDSGDNFSLADTCTGETDVYGVACCYEDATSGIICVGTNPNAEIWRSTDGGQNFSQVSWTPTSSPTVLYSMVCPYKDSSSGIFLAGTNDGGYVLRSTDAGANWTEVTSITGESNIYKMRVLKEGQTDGVVLLGTYNNAEIHRSTDSGATWSEVKAIGGITGSTDLTYVMDFGILHDPASYDNQMVIAVAVDTSGDRSELWRSRDQGATWEKWLEFNLIDDTPSTLDYANSLGRTGDDSSMVLGRRAGGILYHWRLTGAPGDYLGWQEPDTELTLTTAPHEVLVTTGDMHQRITVFDDKVSEARVSLSDIPEFYGEIQWNMLTAANAGKVADFFFNPAKGMGRGKTFLWEHPEDGYTYTVRFDGPVKRSPYPNSSHSLPGRLKLLGVYNIA